MQMSTGPTVSITEIQDYPAIKMHWQRSINKEDVAKAFQEINAALDNSQEPLYVIVDLLEDPIFPFTETIQGAMSGPFRHPALAEWLVIGNSRFGQMIGRILANASRRNNIKWYENEAEVMAYLENIRSNIV